MRSIAPKIPEGRKLVIIVGGGFAGLNAARTLAGNEQFEVVLIDQKNHHLFQPFLYQVATAGLTTSDIAVPIRAEFSEDKNVRVHLGRVDSVNLVEKNIIVDNDIQLPFNYLLLTCGSTHSYFGKDEWEQFAPGLKTLEQALEIRRRILSAFEHAENELDPELQRTLLNFVVVGGGPTGVEMAGAIADISQTVLKKDFRRISSRSAHVTLIEAGPRILPSFAPSLSEAAARDLEELGVTVRSNTRVEDLDAEGVTVAGGERISARTVIWAAGVQAESLGKTLGVETDRAGRIKVNPDLSVPGFPTVFVAGDLAHVATPDGQFLPGVAPAAIQGGKRAAKNIILHASGKATKNFRYFDKGQMATIGRGRAIAQMGRIRFDGFLAWVAWLFVHIIYLVDFRNRLSVLFNWCWNYLFSKRGSRLIVNKDWR